jgi:Mu-like prophage I protein
MTMKFEELQVDLEQLENQAREVAGIARLCQATHYVVVFEKTFTRADEIHSALNTSLEMVARLAEDLTNNVDRCEFEVSKFFRHAEAGLKGLSKSEEQILTNGLRALRSSHSSSVSSAIREACERLQASEEHGERMRKQFDEELVTDLVAAALKEGKIKPEDEAWARDCARRNREKFERYLAKVAVGGA